jgi:hypothetical protein
MPLLLGLVIRQACLHCFWVDIYADEFDAVSLFVLFFLYSEFQIAVELTQLSIELVWCLRISCGVQEDGEIVVNVVE